MKGSRLLIAFDFLHGILCTPAPSGFSEFVSIAIHSSTFLSLQKPATNKVIMMIRGMNSTPWMINPG